MEYPDQLTVAQAIVALSELDPHAVLEVQMSTPNGYTFAIGRIQAIFHNGESAIVDTFVTDSEIDELLDDGDDEFGDRYDDGYVDDESTADYQEGWDD